MTSRPEMYRFHNGEKSKLPFLNAEYENRLSGLRSIMAKTGVETAVFTSMHSVAYYSGFLYCSYRVPSSPFVYEFLGNICIQDDYSIG